MDIRDTPQSIIPTPEISPPPNDYVAIRSLLAQLEIISLDFSVDPGKEIEPFIPPALLEWQGMRSSSSALEPIGPPPLEAGPSSSSQHQHQHQQSLADFLSAQGYDHGSNSFIAPLDIRIFNSRIKALMYDNLEIVGCGTYSDVYIYRAHHKLDGSMVTLKKLRISGDADGVTSTAIREISMLRELSKCNYIVKLLDTMLEGHRIYLVLEYLDLDLAQYLQINGAPCGSIKIFMWQLLKGLVFAHERRVVHRDLKPHNVLLERHTGRLKIADLGLARTFTPPAKPYTHEVVTLLYRPPEILLGSTCYSSYVDMWSLGCIFAEMALGSPLFQGDSEIGQLYQIFKVLGTPDEKSWPGVASLPDWQPIFPKWTVKPLLPAPDVVPPPAAPPPAAAAAAVILGVVSPPLPPPPSSVPLVIPVGEKGLDLLNKLLVYEPEKRITARKALDHAYFDDIRQMAEVQFP